LPAGQWRWRQSWCDLLFAHWPVPSELLRQLVPNGLEIQEFEGTSWIGLVPFRMEGVMRRPWPDLPWVSAFPEMNVRTYVERDGKPGVWFLSLDATNALAIWSARRFFYLPYYRAAMKVSPRGGGIQYESRRSGAEFTAAYGPASDVYEAARGSLEYWLTERYCLYALGPNGGLWRTEVHHFPWPLQAAEVSIASNSMFEFHGLSVSGEPALVHFARRLDVVVWDPERVS
jgi:uncharacterized protein YqjF (DUF2071 family)